MSAEVDAKFAKNKSTGVLPNKTGSELDSVPRINSSFKSNTFPKEIEVSTTISQFRENEMPTSLSPVTALAISSPYLLAAEGPYIKIYGIQDAQLIAKLQIFHEQTIHGIAASENHDELETLRVVIWGGCSIAILYGSDLKAILEDRKFDISPQVFTAPDWILSVALSASIQERDFILLTAHNSLLRAEFSQQRKLLLQSLDSPARSILYSAHTIWETSNSVIVAAGTVFGEIVVWRCHLGEVSIATVLFTFTGHEGSIFGVHISPQFHDSRGALRRVLSSCSDDRTIRLWDLSSAEIQKESSRNGANSKLTGPRPEFGDNGNVSVGETEGSKCLAVAWGHSSRIWRVRTHLFGQGDKNAGKIGLFSFGEDATCQLWSIDPKIIPNSQPSNMANLERFQLTHCKTFAYHTGKHIWSADISSLDDYHCLIATGGADGKLGCFEISSTQLEPAGGPPSICSNSVQDPSNLQHGFWTLEDILTALKPMKDNRVTPTHSHKTHVETNLVQESLEKSQANKRAKKMPQDSLNRFCFVAQSMIILTTTFGHVLLGTNQSQVQMKWQELQMPNESLDLRGYSVVASIPKLHLAVMSGANGNIYKYCYGRNIDKMGSVNGKVAALFLITDPNDEQSVRLLVTVLGKTEASLFHWREDGASETIQSSSPVFLPPKFIVTGAGGIGQLIVVGFRNGAIGVIDPNRPGDVALTYRPPTGEHTDAITSIIEIPSTGQVIHLVAASRTGAYKILTLDIGNSSNISTTDISMTQVHHSATPVGSIEEAWFEGSILYFAGFRGKQFLVWNETKKCEVMTIEESGGAHISYAYCPLKGASGGGTLVYSKASKLYLHTQDTASHKIIKEGGHGREIKACASSANFFATGAEDTMIRIWKFHDENTTEDVLKNKFECISIIEKHTTGIQHLQWHETNYLFSSGGTEEFHIWAIQEIPNFGLGVICEATLRDLSPEQDLRITSFDIIEFPNHCELVLSEKTFLISLAYSDSTIKTYIYSKSHGFHCIAQAKYKTNCLTQLRYLPNPRPVITSTENENGDAILDFKINILTAATDGHLTTWTLHIPNLHSLQIRSWKPSKPIPLIQMASSKIHQNAIKSLDLISLSDISHVIVTGGDDNAIAFSVYNKENFQPKITILRNAHGAAVTALSIIKGDHGDEDGFYGEFKAFKLVTTSNDQRVKIWDVKVGDDGGEVEVEVIGDDFTAVADVGDMAVLGKGQVVVVGNGMDVWSV